MNQQSGTAVVDKADGLPFQRCKWCGSVQTRPSLLCRICCSESLEWELSSGLGRVAAPHCSAIDHHAPVRLTRIKLDEGPLVDGWVLDLVPERPSPGARVRFVDAHTPSGRPIFELAGEE